MSRGKPDPYEIMNAQPKSAFRAWAGLAVCVLVLAIGAIAAGLILYRATQTSALRCYRIDPPLTLAEDLLMNGKVYDCLNDNCRLVIHTLSSQGTVCYFPAAFSDR